MKGFQKLILTPRSSKFSSIHCNVLDKLDSARKKLSSSTIGSNEKKKETFPTIILESLSLPLYLNHLSVLITLSSVRSLVNWHLSLTIITRETMPRCTLETCSNHLLKISIKIYRRKYINTYKWKHKLFKFEYASWLAIKFLFNHLYWHSWLYPII